MDLKALQFTPPWEWPDDTGARLLAVLDDEQADPSDRNLAAELAGDSTVINEELAGRLLSILRNGAEPEQLRAKAAISLGPALELADTDGFEYPEEVPITPDTFHEIQNSLRKLYADTAVPKEVRRRILEASVRAPIDWHKNAVRSAYASGDQDWKLTAVFCMRWVRGFDEEILEALSSTNPDIHCEAVLAAGNWALDDAWPHVTELLTSADTDKPLLLAAIDAVAAIRPQEALELLDDLADSEDEEIAEAVEEALALAGLPDEEDDDEGDDFLR